jgi:hypothetical protein
LACLKQTALRRFLFPTPVLRVPEIDGPATRASQSPVVTGEQAPGFPPSLGPVGLGDMSSALEKGRPVWTMVGDDRLELPTSSV